MQQDHRDAVPSRRSSGRRTTAAEYVRRNEREMEVIIAGLAESAEVVRLAWAAAVASIDHDPDAASRHLGDAWARLTVLVKIERQDATRHVNRVMALIEKETEGREGPVADS